MAIVNNPREAAELSKKSPNLDDPSYFYEKITPSDEDNFTDDKVCRAINAADDCSASLVRPDGTTVVDYPLHKGYNPIMCIRVNATGTDVVDLWALF
jgi:hypothetical protein